MDASDRGAAQARIALAAALLNSAMLHQVFIELLQVTGSQLVELDLTNPWDGVALDDQLVAICGGWSDVGFGVELIPTP